LLGPTLAASGRGRAKERVKDDDVSWARDETHDTESRRKRGQNGVACFLHLRDLVYLHPEAASASAVSFVETLEAKVIAEKAARARS